MVEIIKALVELLKPGWWPCAIVAIVWIIREPLRAVIKGIEELVLEYKGTKARIKIAPDIKTAEEAVPIDKHQAQKLILKAQAESKSTASVQIRLRDAQRQASAIRSMGNDLKSLETLNSIAEKVPRAAIKEGWEILSKNIIETAEVFGFKPVEGGRSNLSQAVHYLTLNILNSQDFMIGVYALKTALQKVDETPNANVSAKDTQDFIRSCMGILALLISALSPE